MKFIGFLKFLVVVFLFCIIKSQTNISYGSELNGIIYFIIALGLIVLVNLISYKFFESKKEKPVDNYTINYQSNNNGSMKFSSIIKDLAIILFIVFSCYNFFSFSKDKKWEPQAIEAQTELQQEIGKFDILPGATQTGFNSFHKYTTACVEKNYSTNKSYPEIKEFYLRESARNGWLFTQEDLNTNYNFLRFIKGNYRFTLQYDKSKATAEKANFGIGLIWDKKNEQFKN